MDSRDAFVFLFGPNYTRAIYFPLGFGGIPKKREITKL